MQPDQLTLAIPTPEQVAWQDLEVGMFLHFGPATWQDQEYDDLSTPLGRINPAKLDTDQWVNAAESMGAKFIIFVAKHTGGFCWWQTDTTDYSVKNTPWRGGKGDVLKELSESCRKRGIKLAVYLSPIDLKHNVGIGGRCEKPEEQERYNRIYRQQLTEVLSRYGEIVEVWFDGSVQIEVGGILRQYAPKAMIYYSPHITIRWVGNEDGIAPYPCWNAVKRRDLLVCTGRHSDPNGDVWIPVECGCRIRAQWFWNSKNAHTLKSLDQLMEMYYRSVGHGAVLVLNHAPDTSGRIPEADVRRGAEFGAEVKRRFSQPLAQTSGTGERIDLDLGQPARIDQVVLMEDIAHGERVREYVVEGWRDGGWQAIGRGSAIGHKKIERFAAVEVSKLRWRSLRCAATPMIRQFSASHTGVSPESVTLQLDAWNTHILAEWNEPNVTGTSLPLDIDLVPYCPEATQYEVEFKRIDTGQEVTVESITLVHGGVEAPEFIQPGDHPGSFVLSITGLDRHMRLRARVRVGSPAVSRGRILISKRR